MHVLDTLWNYLLIFFNQSMNERINEKITPSSVKDTILKKPIKHTACTIIIILLLATAEVFLLTINYHKLWSYWTELFPTSYVYFTSWARFCICTLNPVNITLNENLTIQKQNRIISKDRKSCHSKRFIWHGKNYYFCVWIVSCNMSPFKKSLKVTYFVRDCQSYF